MNKMSQELYFIWWESNIIVFMRHDEMRLFSLLLLFFFQGRQEMMWWRDALMITPDDDRICCYPSSSFLWISNLEKKKKRKSNTFRVNITWWTSGWEKSCWIKRKKKKKTPWDVMRITRDDDDMNKSGRDTLHPHPMIFLITSTSSHNISLGHMAHLMALHTSWWLKCLHVEFLLLPFRLLILVWLVLTAWLPLFDCLSSNRSNPMMGWWDDGRFNGWDEMSGWALSNQILDQRRIISGGLQSVSDTDLTDVY